MPRIQTQFKSDMSLEPRGIMGASILVPAGHYMATVLNVKYKETQHKHAVPNPSHPKGFQTYAKLTPRVQLHDEDETILERQELVLGTLDEDNRLFRPQEDGKSPIWGGDGGALFMLVALGLLSRNDETGTLTLDEDTDDINDQIVRIETSFNGYVKGLSNWDSEKMDAMLNSVYGGIPPFEAVPALVLLYNTQKHGSVIYREGVPVEDATIGDCMEATSDTFASVKALENDKRLRLQTCIIGWYGLTAEEIAENGYYSAETDSKVYASEPEDETNRLGGDW